jgi:excisionase family DNA binding protein
VAVALQVIYRTVTAMIKRKEIAYSRIGKKLVRIPVEEVWANRGAV